LALKILPFSFDVAQRTTDRNFQIGDGVFIEINVIVFQLVSACALRDSISTEWFICRITGGLQEHTSLTNLTWLLRA
jgi:hypothetical protein